MSDIRDVLESGEATDAIINGSSESAISYEPKAVRNEVALDLECRTYSADQLVKAKHSAINDVNCWHIPLEGGSVDEVQLIKIVNL